MMARPRAVAVVAVVVALAVVGGVAWLADGLLPHALRPSTSVPAAATTALGSSYTPRYRPR